VQPDSYEILIVDDEESMREFLAIMLHREGYRVDAVADGAMAVARLKERGYDLIISDIKMPRMNGFELLAHVREKSPETMMIMITAFSTTEDAVEAMKQGAYDYIIKPFRNEEIRLIVKNALERRALRQENLQLKQALDQRYSFGNLIGKSKAMQEVFDLVQKVAGSRANVLITGESGTGKELVAKAVHYNSERKEKPFIPINCGAIPENLLESELFGHEKGSFTGAVQQKPGLFEMADGGTLFLDEIGELPAAMQVKLLRVLQEREFRRVGGTRNIRIDVRLIAATNKDLEVEVGRGGFREDLFYRLTPCRRCVPGARISPCSSSISTGAPPASTGSPSPSRRCGACSITTGRGISASWRTSSSAALSSGRPRASPSPVSPGRCRGARRPASGSRGKSPTAALTSTPTLVVSRRKSCSRRWPGRAGCARRPPSCSGSPSAPYAIAWPSTTSTPAAKRSDLYCHRALT